MERRRKPHAGMKFLCGNARPWDERESPVPRFRKKCRRYVSRGEISKIESEVTGSAGNGPFQVKRLISENAQECDSAWGALEAAMAGL